MAFDFNAPQFVDFNCDLDDSDGADKFFDVESEEPQAHIDNEKENYQPSSITKIKQEVLTPQVTASPSTILRSLNKEIKTERTTPVISSSQRGSAKSKNVKEETSNKKRKEMLKAVRRLSGVEGVATSLKTTTSTENLSQDLEQKLSVKAKKRTHFDGVAIDIKSEKEHSMTTRKDEAKKTPRLELRSRVVEREDEASRKRKLHFDNQASGPKYLALAEQVLHFQKDTPPRFHTHRRRSSVGGHRKKLNARHSYRPRVTVAATPKLLTKVRSRPSTVLSQREREELEVEEMRKHQVKAMPLNVKIFQPVPPSRKSMRPTTVQEPFNLTTEFKKPLPKVEPDRPFHFQAKPVPKRILERPVGVAPRVELPVTVPQSPAITKTAKFKKPIRIPTLANNNKDYIEEGIDGFGVPYSSRTQPKNTVVKPFSFEERDKEMMQRKEKKIQEFLEAEKKAREFKANPLPTFAQSRETSRCSRTSHMDCSRSPSKMVEEFQQPFKARSPRVLRKPKFEPVLEHSSTQPLDIELWTERRRQEREQFELKQMEKEDTLRMQREQIEVEKKRKEEEEIARLRQELVHKAQPMPKFKAMLPKPTSTLPLTEPKSPRFSKRARPNCNDTK